MGPGLSHLRHSLNYHVSLRGAGSDETDFDLQQIPSRSLRHSKDRHDTRGFELGDIGDIDALNSLGQHTLKLGQTRTRRR